jgi:cysteine desulfurase / selenocysteine lyase
VSLDLSNAATLDREFPVRRNLVYLNHAAVAPLPRRVADAIVAHVEESRDRGAANWRRAYAAIEATREKAARFIGAAPSEIAFLPNTSWCLNLVALAFPWREGDNVVTDDMEFPSNAHPWGALESRGVERRVAANRDGRVTAEDVAALVDARTRVVAVSWVAFHNGWVFPIDEIGAFCRERGILLVVDAIQGLGALPMDVSRTGAHVLAADAHKWLYGAEGGAIFYVSEEARDRVPAIMGGWWSLRYEGSYLSGRAKPYESARRYEPGTPPVDHVIGLGASLDLLEEIGKDAVRTRVLRLVRALRDGLAGRGWTIATPEPPRSGILSAVPPDGAANVFGWAKALEERGVIVSPREGAIRFSPHAGNDADEIERALRVVDEIGSA